MICHIPAPPNLRDKLLSACSNGSKIASSLSVGIPTLYENIYIRQNKIKRGKRE